MSQINVNRIKDSNEGAPDFPSGVNVGGITSTVTLGVTNLNPTNVNVSGVVTATTLDGNLLATGTPTLGLGVTINTSGLNISGVATAGIVSATTLYGDGANLTGIALTIAPLNYNPAVNSQASHLGKASGIGLTFNQGVKAGSGNVTLSLANAGVAGTVVENFGVGNSVTYSNGDTITITPTADLSVGQNYHLSYPSGAFTNIGGDLSYVGTAYTFQARTYSYQLWGWGNNERGQLAQNIVTQISSPVQIPGLTWSTIGVAYNTDTVHATKTDGTLWAWGKNDDGSLGTNQGPGQTDGFSSPVQIPGTDWAGAAGSRNVGFAVKTNGTLWGWGAQSIGQIGVNNRTQYSSPVQIPGTTWNASKFRGGYNNVITIKTDGTLFAWGSNAYGQLGDGSTTQRSSPTQIPGTTWTQAAISGSTIATKSDGTLWTWGNNNYGSLGHNQGPGNNYSSPKQIPGTNWTTSVTNGMSLGHAGYNMVALKTDGTLWVWGRGSDGEGGWNTTTAKSSPVQLPGTNWRAVEGSGGNSFYAQKTDGTMWVWGHNEQGQLGQNSQIQFSSPVQIPGTDWNYDFRGGDKIGLAMKQI